MTLVLLLSLLIVPTLTAATTAIGQGFETGADGSRLGAPWSVYGSAQRAEYDSARAKVGTMSGWITGPAAATYAGIGEKSTSGLSTNGVEQTFWLYFDTTNQFRVIDDWASSTADRAFFIQFSNNGAIYVFTDRAGSPGGYATHGYTQVGTYSTGWTQFRVTYDFSTQTYQLSKRASATEAWTPLKAAAASGNDIPFRGTNTVTATHGLLIRAYQNANLWVDDVQMLDPDTPAPSAPTRPETLYAGDSPADETGSVDVWWAAATDDVAVTGYKLYRGTAPGVYDTTIALAPLTSYTDTTALPGRRYYYAVAALDGDGLEGARSPEWSVVARDAQLSALDLSFENGTDGLSITSPPWTLVNPPGTHIEYDSTRAKDGALSAWLQGGGISEMSATTLGTNGAEVRFWAYFDTTSHVRYARDLAVSGLSAHYLAFDNTGGISARTDRSAAGYTAGGYTQVGTYGVGWTEFRIVYDFGAQTYQLSKRASAAEPWTPLKAAGASGYGIPFKSADTITRTGGVYFYAVTDANLWVDDIRCSESGITDADTTPPSAPAALLASDHPSDAGTAIDLSWTAASDDVGVTSYKLYRGTAPGVYGTPVTLLASTSYTDDTCVAGTRYYYAVSAVDAAGNESAKSPETSALAVDDSAQPPTFDGTFENGDDGDSLASGWTISNLGRVGREPQRAEYDDGVARSGSMSAWILGPSDPAANGGIHDTRSAGMADNGAEIRFWVFCENTNTRRLIYGYGTSGPTYMELGDDGMIKVRTVRSGDPRGYITNAFVPVGTYSTGWTEFRIVYDFTGPNPQTYTMSMRSSESDPWTRLKAATAVDYYIPFWRDGTITQTSGMAFDCMQNVNMWIDDFRYSALGFGTGAPADTTPPRASAALLAWDHPSDEGSAIDLLWTAASDDVGVTAYKLYRGTSPGVYGAPVTLPALTSYTDNTCVAGTRYYYAVSAVDAAGIESAKSPEASALAVGTGTPADTTPPSTPTGLLTWDHPNDAGGAIDLSWTASTDDVGVTAYKLYRGTTIGVYGTPVTLPASSTTFTDNTVLTATAYYYVVTAVDAAGNESAKSAVQGGVAVVN